MTEKTVFRRKKKEVPFSQGAIEAEVQRTAPLPVSVIPAIQTSAQAKEELHKALYEKLMRSAREDPNVFLQYAGSYNEKMWKGQAPLHVGWQQSMTEHKMLLIVCPREHGKTTQMMYRIVWELGRNPNLRIKLVCQGDDTAVKRLIAIIDLIENNPRVREVFPELREASKGTWTKTKIYVERTVVGMADPSIEACGILSTGTGSRADLIIFDDPVDFRNAISQPALRETIKEAYRNVWMNVLEEDGRVWYIATLWHKDDLTHELMASGDYKVINKFIDENFTPIWEEKWNKASLKKKLKTIGTRAFDRGFRNKALTDEDALFTDILLARCVEKDLRFGNLPSSFDKSTTRYYAGVDIGAGKNKNKGAFSVMITLAVDGAKKCPVSIVRGRYTSPQFTRLILDEIATFKHDLIFVENNAQQEALIQWIDQVAIGNEELPPVKGFYTGTQKQDSEIGLPSITVEMEQGRWILPSVENHEKPCHCGFCTLIKEMLEYPIGKYTDILMALWFAKEASRSMTFRMPRMYCVSDDDDDDNFITVDETTELELVGG